ncbi:cytidylyltransferase [Lasallia pustulata]|nr:cytidylyltransferase [Lasallia pustulata]
MSPLLPTLRTALHSFTSSNSNLRILRSLPSPTPPPPKTLYILDSSFNPPTLAHLRIATSALLDDTHGAIPKRLLLLLATQNADKAPKPASFEHRLAMMTIFASDLLENLKGQQRQAEEGGGEGGIAVDIALTTLPHFHAKSAALASSALYPNPEQVHLIGYDTLTRLLDPKYYPPAHTLAPLTPLFSDHRVRATYRTDDRWGGRGEQRDYLERLRRGEMEKIGGEREWAGRIELVEGRKEGEEAVSSTKVREAVREGDRGMLGKLVTEGVADWILKEGLYTDGDEG